MTSNRKSRRIRFDRIAYIAIACIALIAACIALNSLLFQDRPAMETSNSSHAASTSTTTTTTVETTTSKYPPSASRTTTTRNLETDATITARNAVLIRSDRHEILAEKGADEVIEPASMTKIMTMVTAIESLTAEQLAGTFTMDDALIAPLKARQAVCAGFADGEVCTITDLFYGMMLPSGADAAEGLAVYTSGSTAAFVQCMNEKAAELGLTQSHFVNCTGLHEDGHVSTVHEIARLLEYAIQIPFCRTVMSAATYTTASTPQHPDGIALTSIVKARLGSLTLDGLEIRGGKTGFTNQAGQCLATWGEDENGRLFLCVVAGCEGPMDAIYDTLSIYDVDSGVCSAPFIRPPNPQTDIIAAP